MGGLHYHHYFLNHNMVIMAKVEFYDQRWQRLKKMEAAALAYQQDNALVAYKGTRWHVGQKVEIKPLNVIDGVEVKQYAIVKSLKNGLPETIEVNGKLETVFGYIIQIIPFLIRLIDSIKDLIQSIKK